VHVSFGGQAPVGLDALQAPTHTPLVHGPPNSQIPLGLLGLHRVLTQVPPLHCSFGAQVPVGLDGLQALTLHSLKNGSHD
jgi:hypothetical protein